MREAELAGLPDAARRYLRFAGVVGRPADWSFQLHSRGRFRFRQARWSTPVQDWREAEGRRLPSSGSAIWHLPDGPFTYAEFTFNPDDISRNVAPVALQPDMARSATGPGRSRPRPRDGAIP